MRNYSKVVFFPSEVGLAHLIRSLAIAEVLLKEGCDVSLVLPRRKAGLLRTVVPLVYLNSGWKDDLSYLLGYRDRKKLRQMMYRERVLLELMKPDLVVADTRQTAVAAATDLGIRTVCIANTTGLPYGPRLPNFGLPPVLFRLIAPVLEGIAWHLEMRAVRLIHQSKPTTLYIVPEPKGYLLPRKESVRFRYVGAVKREGHRPISPPWMKSLRPDGKTVYLTMGGSGYAEHFSVRLIRLLLKNGYTVIVSGNVKIPAGLKKENRLFAARYIDGDAAARRVDAVICHGGYHTMMQAVSAGTPVVAVPQNPNQMLHALRFQELGLGVCVTDKSYRALSCLLGERWGYYRDVNRMDAGPVMCALELMLKQKVRYGQALKAFGRYRPDGVRSADRAAAIIINELKKKTR